MGERVEPHEKVYRSKKAILYDNFLGGIAWAVGATIGLAIIIAILTLFVKNVNLVPYVGEFVAEVLEEVLQKNPQLIK